MVLSEISSFVPETCRRPLNVTITLNPLVLGSACLLLCVFHIPFSISARPPTQHSLYCSLVPFSHCFHLVCLISSRDKAMALRKSRRLAAQSDPITDVLALPDECELVAGTFVVHLT